MADKKISALTSATTPLAGTEVLPIVQSNTTVKVAVSDLTAGRAISASEVTVSTLTSGRVPYVGTSGKLSDTPNFQWDVSNSRLGIGVSPSYTLHVARSSAGFIGAFRATDVTASAQVIIAGNSQGDLIAASTTTGNGLIYADSGKTLSLGANGSTAARLTVTTAGDVSVPSNNLVIGTAGKGIDFSANTHAAGMTSELLTWYEEGTWTPTLGGTWSVNPINMAGSYTRIGNTVYLQLEFTGGTKATTLSGWFTGVPFNIGKRGTGAVVDDSVTAKGSALFANTNRVWVTENAFSGANIVTGFYFV
jgi:hypothetical protein